MKMWPTPTQDSATERTKKYSQGGKPLTLAVQEEEIKMWRTPDAHCNRGPSSKERMKMKLEKGMHQSQRSSSEYDVANPSSHSNDNGQEQREISQQEQIELGGGSGGTLWPSNWEFEPNVGRVANGVPGRVHRLKGLGNSIVPKIAEEIGKAIIGVYNGSR
jgi:DNA (cytosine-5)-methyltransferase 1